MISSLEELSLNAWPALQTLMYDGWVLRFANGYTKRANSINPLYARCSSLDIDQKLDFCESVFRSQKLPVILKITPSIFPSNLDEILQARGYRKDSLTSVQILEMSPAKSQSPSAVEIREDLSDEWLDGYCRMSAVSAVNRETQQRMLMNMLPRHCYAAFKIDDRQIACGLGVLQSGYIGLFDIVTDEAFRGRGFGQQVVAAILAWGQQYGAENAYLQVMLNNSPALRLYSKIGFIEQYQYWYRIKA
jgi:ribosomal protein S18 acetylase RimI-like enzyme